MLLFKSQKQIIQEIHNEFDSAEDRLLTEADKLLLELKIPTETEVEKRASRLLAVGFKNAETVVSANSLAFNRNKQREILVKTKAQADLIRYYKQAYPFQKFLTEDELDRICQKYGLIHAPVEKYIKDVPEKNISDIENCKPLLKGDAKPNEFILRVDKCWPHDNFPKDLKEILTVGFKIPRGLVRGDSDALLLAKEFGGYTGDYKGYVSSVTGRIITEEINFTGLFIAAPPSHFNLTGLSKKGQYGYKRIFVTEIKDPIVFRYVNGGIQVITKWGLEANDPDLVNEIDN